MNRSVDSVASELSRLREINECCNRFEASWRAGNRPRIEDFFDPKGGDLTLLRHLILLELDYRRSRGEMPRIEEYLERFPALGRVWLEAAITDSVGSGSVESRTVPGIQADEFLHRVVQVGLISEQERQRLRSELQPGATADSLIARMIAEGKLNEFQARVLVGSMAIPFILGPYVLEGWIAAGGMGNVFRATHRQMKRTVAIKVVHGGADANPLMRRRFQREVELAARLHHPNVVAAFDAGEQDGVVYLVTEFIDGEDLGRVVRREGPFPPKRAVELLAQAARGLQYAHSRGIIHRDVKPSNLILDRAGVVRLLDVGLAMPITTGDDGAVGSGHRWVGEPGLTTAGTLMGTIDYVAPEQADDPRNADERSDVYGLGGTLYFLLTARTPFEGTAAERLRAHREASPPSARAGHPKVPLALDRLIQQMMAKRPEDRPANVTAVLDALQTPTRRMTRRAMLLTGGAAVIAFGTYAWGIANKKRHRELPRIPFDAVSEQTRWAGIIGKPATFRNSLGMQMVLMPPGAFVMGTPDEVIQREIQRTSHPLFRECLQAEKQREATVAQPFYLSATEVTVAQYRQFIENSNPRYVTLAEQATNDAQGGWGWNPREGWQRKQGCSWQHADELDLRDDHPVSNVTWDDAMAFCHWLSSETNSLHRLPTEVEWEFACRAGSEGLWCFGDDESKLALFAWSAQNCNDQPQPVGRKRPNRLGLFDLHGNVLEWCDSGEEFLRPSTDVLGPRPEEHRPVRGGYFRSSAERTRSAARFWEHKNGLGPGFRVVQVVNP